MDLRDLNGGTTAAADLEYMMCDPSRERELWSWGVSGATDRNIHKGLTVVLGPMFQGSN